MPCHKVKSCNAVWKTQMNSDDKDNAWQSLMTRIIFAHPCYCTHTDRIPRRTCAVICFTSQSCIADLKALGLYYNLLEYYLQMRLLRCLRIMDHWSWSVHRLWQLIYQLNQMVTVVVSGFVPSANACMRNESMLIGMTWSVPKEVMTPWQFEQVL